MTHLLLKLLFMIATLTSLTYAEIKTKDLGVLNFKKGLVGRLYKSTLTGSESYNQRIVYLEKMQYLTDGELIAQRVITNFRSQRIKNKMNEMFGFYYDPDYSELIVELRGYVKAPVSGYPTLSTFIYANIGCDNRYLSQSATHHWVINSGLYLNTTTDGRSICTYNTSASTYDDASSGENVRGSTSTGGNIFMNTDYWFEGQYYPVLFRSRISGDGFINKWDIQMNNREYSLDELSFYDPQDDFVANDANHLAKFPVNCPQFHAESFADTTYVIPTSIVPNRCVTSTSSSIITSSSTSSTQSSVITSSSHVVTSSKVSSSEVSSSEVPSSEVSSIEVSSSEVSSSEVFSSEVTSSEVSSSKVASSKLSSSKLSSSKVSSSKLSSSKVTSSKVTSSKVFSSILPTTMKSNSIISTSMYPSLIGSGSVISSSVSSRPMAPSSIVSRSIESDKLLSSLSDSSSVFSNSQDSRSSVVLCSSTSSVIESQHSSKEIVSSTVSSIVTSHKYIPEMSVEPSSTPVITFSTANSSTSEIVSVSNAKESPAVSISSSVSRSQSAIETSKTPDVVSSSIGNFGSDNSISTITVNKPDIETSTTVTCLESQNIYPIVATNCSTSKLAMTYSSETTMSVSQGHTTVINVQTTKDHNSATIIYAVSTITNPIIDLHSTVSLPTTVKYTTTQEIVFQPTSDSYVTSLSDIVQPYEVHSTTSLVQTLSDGSYISTYNPVLFVLTILISLL